MNIKIKVYRLILRLKNYFSNMLVRDIRLNQYQKEGMDLLKKMLDDDNTILLGTHYKRIVSSPDVIIIIERNSMEVFSNDSYNIIMFDDSNRMTKIEILFDHEVDKRIHYIDKSMHNKSIKHIITLQNSF